MTAVIWEATTVEHPARTAALASMTAVSRKDKAGWLELFAADGVVEDPVGKSPFDPDGLGHHGHGGISAFWDKAIAAVERFEFRIADSFAAGDEVANVGTITAFLAGGMRIDTDGVFVYRVAEDGLIRSMRAFWELQRAMATIRQDGP